MAITRQNQLSSSEVSEIRSIIREEVRNILINELLPRYLKTGSVVPTTVRPVKLDDSEPANLQPLVYDKANGVVTFV